MATASKKSMTNPSAVRALFSLNKPANQLRYRMIERTRFGIQVAQARMFSTQDEKQIEINVDNVEQEPVIS
jgi:hypothetical protein